MNSVKEWKEENVGEQLKLLSGFPFASNKFSNLEGFPLIRIRDVVDSTIETYYLGNILPTYVIKKDDVLIGMDGDFNLARWKNRDALLNQRVLKVDVLDSNQLDIDFIYYWLQPYVKKINDLTAATTVKHLSTKDISKAISKIPCQAVQAKIGAVLKTIDQTIEKTEALIEKYQYIKAGLMHDLFTRGIGADGKLRPPREQAPELYQETLIGWIPKEWNIHQLIDMAAPFKNSTVIGPFGSDLVMSDYKLDGTPIIFVRDVKEDSFNWVSNVFISTQKTHKLFAHRVNSGDILATKMGLPPCVSCVYPEDMPMGIITADMIRMTVDCNKVNSYWISAAINHDRVKRQVAAITAGVTRPKVTLADFRNLKIALPDLQEQLRINSVLDRQRQLILSEMRLLTKLQKQKSGLMHDLLTGKVPVTVDK